MNALFVVDMQNDFVDPDGILYVPGGEAIVEPINALIRHFLDLEGVIVFTRDWHPSDSRHFNVNGGSWPTHCLAATWGARFHPQLLVPRGSLVVHKGIGVEENGYSGFDHTVEIDIVTAAEPKWIPSERKLQDLLLSLEVGEIFISGLATDYCVKKTALDARDKFFLTRVIVDACRAVNLKPGDANRAIEEMSSAGVEMVTSKDVLTEKA